MNEIKRNQIKRNQIKRNQIKRNQIKKNQIKRNQIKRNQIKRKQIKNKPNKINPFNMCVVATHNAGFFSCCSVKLSNIVNFINKYKKIPDIVDSSVQFDWYKQSSNEDITYDYFKHYDTINNIKFTN